MAPVKRGMGWSPSECVRSKRLCIFFAKRSRTRRLDLAIRKPTPKNVVLAARVNANDGPHFVVVGPDRHSWPPDDIENGEVTRMIDFLHTRALRLAYSFKDGPRLRYR